MPKFNWFFILATSIIPLAVGLLYYHQAVLGKVAARYSPAIGQGFTPKIYAYFLLLGVFLSVFLLPVVFHIMHVYSLIGQPGGGPPPEDSVIYLDSMAYLEKYGGNFLTFKHGMFHGILTALFGIWPVLAISGFLEKRQWQYTAVQLGYWVIVFALMGGFINAFGFVALK
jgi:hypothetical protein